MGRNGQNVAELIVRIRGQIAGTSAGEQLREAISRLPNVGGVIDCTGLSGTQTLDVDIFDAGLAPKPVVLLWGAADFLVTATQHVPSSVSMIFRNTRFEMQGIDWLFASKTWSTTSVVTAGEFSIDLNDPTGAVVEAPIVVAGHLPDGPAPGLAASRDETVLVGSISATQTNFMSVGSTVGFPTANGGSASRTLRVDDELIRYGDTSLGTRFSTLERGVGQGGAGVYHYKAPVVRAVYRVFTAIGVSGSLITVGTPLGVSGSAIETTIGTADVAFAGRCLIDASDGLAGGGGFNLKCARRWRIGTGVTVVSPRHCGVALEAAQDCRVDARVENSGGSGASFVRQTEFLRVNAQSWGSADEGTLLYDRESAANDASPFDGGVVSGSLLMDLLGGTGVAGSSIRGTSFFHMRTGVARGFTGAVVEARSSGWVEPTPPRHNSIEIRQSDDNASSMMSLADSYADGSSLFAWNGTAGELDDGGGNGVVGNVFRNLDSWGQAVAAGPIVNPDGRLTINEILVPALGGITVGSPTAVVVGQLLRIVFKNTTNFPGAPILFSASYRLAGNLPSPAAKQNTAITFMFDGQEWIELCRTA